MIIALSVCVCLTLTACNFLSNFNKSTVTESSDSTSQPADTEPAPTEIIDEAVAPTCTESGKTEGKRCATCGHILVAQEDVPPLGHDFVDGICTRCGAESLDINATAWAKAFDYMSNAQVEITSDIEHEPTHLVFINNAQMAYVEDHEPPYNQLIIRYADKDYFDYYTGIDTASLWYYTQHPTGIGLEAWIQSSWWLPSLSDQFDKFAFDEENEKYVFNAEHSGDLPVYFYPMFVEGEIAFDCQYAAVTFAGIRISSIELRSFDGKQATFAVSYGNVAPTIPTEEDIMEQTSEGLEFSYIEETDSYAVSGRGTCTDTHLVIPPYCGDKPITAIARNAFYEDEDLVSVQFTRKCQLKTIGEFAFFGCTSITEFTIPEGVTSIDNAAFAGCVALRSIDIPASVTSIKVDSFWSAGLTSVSIADDTQLTCLSGFAFCNRLTSITIPAGITEIPENSFIDCRSLIEVYNKSSLNITAGSTDFGGVAKYARNVYSTAGGSKLSTDKNGWVRYTDGDEVLLVAYDGTDTAIVVPDDVTSIHQFAFSSAVQLTSVTLPAHLTVIEAGAFSGCSGLTSLSIPASVTYLGEWMLEDSGVSEIHYAGTVEQWQAAKGDRSLSSSHYTVYCSNGDVQY